MKTNLKTLEFIYQDTQIHFLLNLNDDNVMVNATEMAKAFDKRIDVFLKTDHVKEFINRLLFPPNGGNKSIENVMYTTNKATYMNRLLALKFAAWLDVDFEIWIYQTIEKVLFGHYKEHWGVEPAYGRNNNK